MLVLMTLNDPERRKVRGPIFPTFAQVVDLCCIILPQRNSALRMPANILDIVK